MAFHATEEPEGDLTLTGYMYYDPMSTAIVRIHTSQGFVITADGLTSTGYDKAQKIFSAMTPGVVLAIGMSRCGNAEFTDDATGLEFKLEYGSECQHVANRLTHRNIPTFDKYVRSFSKLLVDRIHERIADALKEGLVSESDVLDWRKREEITDLHFAGYFLGCPWFATATTHFNGEDPEIDLKNLISPAPTRMTALWFGSEAIRKILERGEDERFERYRTSGLLAVLGGQATMEEAVQGARSYIEACSDSKAAEVDSYCNSIGGHIHSAIVTEKDGFQWINSPVTSAKSQPIS